MSSGGGPNLRQILSETTRLIKAHPRHFSALSIVFLFPISISALIYTLINSKYCQSLYLFSTPNPKNPSNIHDQVSPLLPQIICNLFTSFFSICATASITYTTFHAVHGRPVTFVDSVKSIRSSFLPLLATLMVKQIIFVLIIIPFVVLMSITYTGLSYSKIELSNVFVFIAMIMTLFFWLLIYLQRKWYVSEAVVVVESLWGYSPLKRSSHLLKGVKRVVYYMILLSGAFGGLLSFLIFPLMANGGGNFEGWNILKVVLLVIVYTVCFTILLLYNGVANTVLFIHCKEEYCGREYVSLPKEDGDVTYVVNVV